MGAVGFGICIYSGGKGLPGMGFDGLGLVIACLLWADYDFFSAGDLA